MGGADGRGDGGVRVDRADCSCGGLTLLPSRARTSSA
jgi:hypothetical protein